MSILKFKSISTKISLVTSLFISILICVIWAYVYFRASENLRKTQYEEIKLSLNNASHNMENSMAIVENSAKINKGIILNYIHLNQEDSVQSLLTNMLDIDQNIYGCGVVFNVESEDFVNKPFLIYASKINDRESKISRVELPRNINSSKSSKYSWLRNTVITNSDEWSVLHDGIIDANIQVCSFSLTIGNPKDDSEAVFFVDISENTIKAILDKSFNSLLLESILVNEQGNYIYSKSNPNLEEEKRIVFNQLEIHDLLSTVSEKHTDGTLERTDYILNGKDRIIFYDVLSLSNWVILYITDSSFLGSQYLHYYAGEISLLFFLNIIIVFVVLNLVIKYMTRPLKFFTDTALEISKGNFDAELPKEASSNEMSRLVQSFSAIKNSLIKYTRDLEESTRREAQINNELQLASKIQDDLLPKIFPPFPDRDDIIVKASLMPAKEIGGDLYNYFIHDEKLYFIIADVSGKSVPAALVMAIANNVFNIVAPLYDDPAEIVSNLNITTCSNNKNSGYFITSLVGILDFKKGEVKLCNAGHNPALMIESKDNIHTLKIAPNLPVGIIKDYKYNSVVFPYLPGMRLLLYTDGVTDAQNHEHQFFGIDRLIESVSANIDKDISIMIDKVLEEVSTFSKGMEQHDDITLMVIEHKPSEIQMPSQLTLINDINELQKVIKFSQTIADILKFDESTKLKINLVLEEAISNIIFYSFPKGSQNFITIYASVRNSKLKIIISDTGKKFDPTKRPDADVNAPLVERPIGGLGITLMRNISDEFTYQRINNKNFLFLSFDIK